MSEAEATGRPRRATSAAVDSQPEGHRWLDNSSSADNGKSPQASGILQYGTAGLRTPARAPVARHGAGHVAARAGIRERIRERGSAMLALPRQHALFCSLLLIATIVRVVAMLGYQPGLWYPDSVSYMTDAVNLYPDVTRSDGYPFFLELLKVFHSVTLVVALQHLLGLAMGVAVYALLRHRYRLPAWGATLAAVPPLLSVYAIQIEHFVLSDTLFAALMTAALLVVLWRPQPGLWACASAGLLLGIASLVRSQGLVLVLPFAIYLLSQFSRSMIKATVALVVTFAAPLAMYAAWFDSANGSFNLTSSTGAFLYGRVATFADCAVVKPPADERFLCVSSPVSKRLGQETYFIWNTSQSPLWHGPGSPFSNKVNDLAEKFAIRAIEAQPAAYLSAVWHSTYLAFRRQRDATPEGQSQNLYMFPAATPESVKALGPDCQYACYKEVYSYAGGRNPSTTVVQPFAGWIRIYQRFAIVSGPLLGLIVLAGLAGFGLAWRRLGNPVQLPWLVGVATIVVPAATASFDARYLVASLPALCIAAALGVQEVGEAGRAAIARRRPPLRPAPDADAALA